MKFTQQKTSEYARILTLSAWGFALVISSFLFLYLGYWIDRTFNTAPSFMLGLFVLGVFLCIARLYQDAWGMFRKKAV